MTHLFKTDPLGERDPSEGAVPERRKSLAGAEPAAQTAPSRFAFLAPYLRGFSFHDILSTRHHSDDFVETRAEFILLRLRFMVFFYAIAVPLWAPVDYLLLSPSHFAPMLVARLLLAAVLWPLGLYALRRLHSRRVHRVLALAIVAPCLFSSAATLILSSGDAETALAGYAMMPFLTIAMLGVFPLTLLWGLALIATVVLIQLGVAASLGRLMTVDTLNTVWALLMFGGIALWVQAGQLLMLLKLYRESTQDPLTGLINRRVMMKRLATETARVNRTRRGSFCVLMFDLDRFKRVNDNHGHLTGDEVLKTTAQVLQRGLRQHDLLARFGGEEFVAILPGASIEEAIAVAERIRQQCRQTQVAAPNGEFITLSTSVGVTEYEYGEAIEVTLARVDDSLYLAKELGRNRVVHSQSDKRSRPGATETALAPSAEQKAAPQFNAHRYVSNPKPDA